MELVGYSFSVEPASIQEDVLPGEVPSAYVLRIARSKALAVQQRGFAEHLIVAADTAVVDGALILGKPVDLADAGSMLRRLRGRTHQVLTAIVVMHPKSRREESDICTTWVSMRQYEDAEIAAYIDSGDPFDKAGAYAIQHPQFHPVERLEGCITNVMGLPVCRLAKLLQCFGETVTPDLPYRCIYETQMVCSFDIRRL
jgi:septum formation protein